MIKVLMIHLISKIALAGIVLVCIISLSVFNVEPVYVCIDATSKKGNMAKICKDVKAQLLLRKMLDVSSVDTIDNRITIVFFVNNEMILEHCEEVLHAMILSREYCRIDYWVLY